MAWLKRKKRAAILAAWIASLALNSACATTHLKWWFLNGNADENQTGLVRRQTGERLTWKQANGYFCLSPVDADQVVTIVRAWDAEHP